MWIDAHTHLDLYGDDLEAALDEVRRNQILCISNSIDPDTYRRSLEIAHRCEWVFPIFGVHPWMAEKFVGRLEEVKPTIAQSPMLGEIGLDYCHATNASERAAQRTVFEFFLQAAQEQDKVVHLHTVGAEKEVLELLERYAVRRALVHGYSGPLDLVPDYVRKGFHFTVSPEVRYSEHIQAIAQAVPMAQLLTETDNPGGPKAYLGRQGMPSLVLEAVRGLAGARGTAPAAILEATRNGLGRLVQADERLRALYDRLQSAGK
jgi:TatD DNase family protein